MSRSCFASFPVCVYKFSRHYLNKIIFIDNSLGRLAKESPCSTEYQNRFRDFEYVQGLQASILVQTLAFILAILVRVTERSENLQFIRTIRETQMRRENCVRVMTGEVVGQLRNCG